MAKGPHGPHGVHAREGAAEHQQVVGVVELRCVTAAARKQREEQPGMPVQGLAGGVRQRRHHGQLRRRQLTAEGVLLADLRLAPARQPVELHDQGLRVLDADLVDPVLVAVQGQQARIADVARRFDGVDDHVRGEHVEGVCVHGEPSPSRAALLICA